MQNNEYLKIKVYIKPNSKNSEFCGFDYDKGCFIFRIKAPAIDNKANIALMNYVKKNFKANCKLISGEKSKIKILAVEKTDKTVNSFSLRPL